MKTKEYLFTEEEIIILREATTEYFQMINVIKLKSEIAKKKLRIVKALKEQFKEDAATI